VKGIAELHGGSARAESAGLGQGSTFTVDLPAAEVPGEPRVAGEPAAVAVARPSARPRRVLIVDDIRDMMEPMQIHFELEEYEVAIAASGPEALAVARTFRPDVVLCDIGLPGMSGYDVARALRADPELRSAHLIALTGFGKVEDRVQAAEAGFDLHLTKPAGPDEVERIVRDLKRWPSPPTARRA
jgi:CheY-like chemotaxis protein